MLFSLRLQSRANRIVIGKMVISSSGYGVPLPGTPLPPHPSHWTFAPFTYPRFALELRKMDVCETASAVNRGEVRIYDYGKGYADCRPSIPEPVDLCLDIGILGDCSPWSWKRGAHLSHKEGRPISTALTATEDGQNLHLALTSHRPPLQIASVQQRNFSIVGFGWVAECVVPPSV